MKREIVRIDRDLCNGCGLCIPNCHEGALQMIDGKATLVSELMCDGLGACLGHCPVEAITIETREAERYNETTVIQAMIPHGKNVILAHLKHLKEHQQFEFLKEGARYLLEHRLEIQFDVEEILQAIHAMPSVPQKMQATPETVRQNPAPKPTPPAGGCPGSRMMSFSSAGDDKSESGSPQKSQLRQWPIQMHLINPNASYFRKADLILAADCVAFSLGGFHSQYLKGKSLAIACPKLDEDQDSYVAKLSDLIDQAEINTLQVMVMEVPCCQGLVRLAQTAARSAKRKVPIKTTMVGIKGDIISEGWL
jgi:NAD-dependent dihydropyrimidine dehydrogenase PreA subunit